jgi:CheY-like chemotaxis protein
VPITPTLLEGLPAWSGQGTILLADDEETVRTVARRMLEMAGFQVLIARDGCEAVDMFTRHASVIRAVLLDMTMPCMAVDEVLPAIRTINAHVPVILSSGYNEQEAVNRFVGAGLAAFIHKPYRYETLLQTLRQALDPPTSE